MATSADLAISAVKANLHLVFEEADATKRKAAIERLWMKSEDTIFVDPERIWNGHAQIDECVTELVKKFAGWVFVEIGKYPTKLLTDCDCSWPRPIGQAQVLPEGQGDHEMLVVRQAWGYGPPGEEPKVYGQDIATLVGGKIKLLYAILAPESSA